MVATQRPPIRWGILGCGDVTEKKSGPNAFNQPGSTLVAVMRRDAAKAADFAARHGVPRWYDDASALLADDEVDAVYIATPPSSHLPLAKLVAAAGKPLVVEKPMARSHAESRALADALSAAGLPCFVAYYRRAYPRMQRLRALVADGAVGRVTQVTYRHTRAAAPGGGWRTDVPLSGGGHFVDVGSSAEHMVHSHTVRPPLGALLSPCAMCGAGRLARARLPRLHPRAADRCARPGPTRTHRHTQAAALAHTR